VTTPAPRHPPRPGEGAGLMRRGRRSRLLGPPLRGRRHRRTLL